MKVAIRVLIQVTKMTTEPSHIEEDCAARLARALGRILVRITAVLFDMIGRSRLTPCPDKMTERSLITKPKTPRIRSFWLANC